MRTEISNEIQKNATRVEGVYTYLHQDKGTRICELERQFSEYLKTSIYRAAKQKTGSVLEDKRHKNKVRLRKLILEDNECWAFTNK